MTNDGLRLDPRFLIGVGAMMAAGAVVLSGVTSTPPGITGTWFSEQGGGAMVRQMLLHFTPEGTFRAVTRDLGDCRTMARGSMSGRWEMTPQNVTLRLEEADGAARTAEEVFELAWLSESRLQLVAPDGGVLGGLRVPAAFNLPPPPGCPEETAPPPVRS